MERNQKPLIEQNRRLAERNRLLQNEIKKGEQKLCHSQDGFLTLVWLSNSLFLLAFPILNLKLWTSFDQQLC